MQLRAEECYLRKNLCISHGTKFIKSWQQNQWIISYTCFYLFQILRKLYHTQHRDFCGNFPVADAVIPDSGNDKF